MDNDSTTDTTFLSDVIRSTTDDFCESFADQAMRDGSFGKMISSGLLPNHVDPQDERVIAVVGECRRAHPDTEWSGWNLPHMMTPHDFRCMSASFAEQAEATAEDAGSSSASGLAHDVCALASALVEMVERFESPRARGTILGGTIEMRSYDKIVLAQDHTARFPMGGEVDATFLPKGTELFRHGSEDVGVALSTGLVVQPAKGLGDTVTLEERGVLVAALACADRDERARVDAGASECAEMARQAARWMRGRLGEIANAAQSTRVPFDGPEAKARMDELIAQGKSASSRE